MKTHTILIADDDYDYLYQMCYHIEDAGFTVIKANSQAEAEAVIGELKPDLALFDLMMENHDSGFVLAYKMKKTYPDVPVIIATAVAGETGLNFGNGNQGGWVKADKYLEKGTSPQVIIEIIKQMLGI
ncbi:MAG TPA: response regulator [Bacteroidales bacterium]|nr:response regulator [Bacteroidales bacterium]HOE03671.1 response regulator [Bacteroidales bacterium]